MNIEIVETPIRFQMHGIGSVVETGQYGAVGFRLMDEMWRAVRDAQIATTGINHWVYLPEGRMFVGVELRGPLPAPIPQAARAAGVRVGSLPAAPPRGAVSAVAAEVERPEGRTEQPRRGSRFAIAGDLRASLRRPAEVGDNNPHRPAAPIGVMVSDPPHAGRDQTVGRVAVCGDYEDRSKVSQPSSQRFGTALLPGRE